MGTTFSLFRISYFKLPGCWGSFLTPTYVGCRLLRLLQVVPLGFPSSFLQRLTLHINRTRRER